MHLQSKKGLYPLSPLHYREDLNLDKEEKPVSKVTFELMNNFKFIAAYDVYSNAWDNQKEEENRSKLNNLISSLFKEEISYSHYYREIEQYKRSFRKTQGFQRVRIQGERKRDFRRKEQRRSRQKRHKR